MILSKLWKKILFILSNEAKIFAFFFLLKGKIIEKNQNNLYRNNASSRVYVVMSSLKNIVII